MTNYTKTTDFAAKDSLPSGDSGKIIRGTEFETEFDNIATAVNSKSDANNPTFTGTVTIDGLTVNGNTVLGNAATDTVTVTADIASNLLPSADDTYNLGAVGAEWNDLFIDGVANIDSLVANTADINGGTVDGVTIGGSSAGAITGTTITGTSFVTSGNMSFGDGDRAVFGAGSDLQVFHDGSNSYIADNGTGDLFISGAANITFRKSGTSEVMAQFSQDGAASLYYDNAAKLATTSTGIDVTGTVTADGLDASTGDITTASIGFNGSRTTTPDGLSYPIIWRSAGTHPDFNSGDLVIQARSDADRDIHFVTGNTPTERMKIASNGDVSLFEDTGTTPKFFWDSSAESLGIGTSSPAYTLDVESVGTNNENIARFSSSGGLRAVINTDGDDDGSFSIYDQNDAVKVLVRSNGGSYFNGGNVGIGTSGASASLTVFDNAGSLSATLNDTSIFRRNDGTYNPRLEIQHSTAGTTLNHTYSSAASNLMFSIADSEVMRINLAGHVGIGNDSPSALLTVGSTTDTAGVVMSVDNGGFSTKIKHDADKAMIYGNSAFRALAFGADSTEAMRIDSSQNLLVGKTVSSLGTEGVTLGPNGQHYFTSEDETALKLNRLTTDGELIQFRKDTSTVGSVGTNVSRFYIHGSYGSGSGLRFDNASIRPATSTGASSDTTTDLGASAARFKDLYLSGGAYLGGIAAANKLDDYEEGTWTATLSDASTGGNNSPTTVTGYYTKIGRLVTARVFNLNDIDTTGMTGSNDLYISLPITASSGLNVGSVIMHGVDLGSGFTQVQMRTVSSSSQALFVKTGSTQADNFVNVSSITSGADDISAITITYEAV